MTRDLKALSGELTAMAAADHEMAVTGAANGEDPVTARTRSNSWHGGDSPPGTATG